MIKCKFCERDFRNSYLATRHAAKFHPQENVGVTPDVIIDPLDMPKVVILKFKQPIEAGVNGSWYTGKEVAVKIEHVEAILETVRNAYGPDVLEIEG